MNKTLCGALLAASIVTLSGTAMAAGGSSAFPTPDHPVPANGGTATSSGTGPITHHHRHHHHHASTASTTDTNPSADGTTPH